MTYVEIPTWVFYMLVFWCISYIGLVVYLLRSTADQMDDMRAEYRANKIMLDDWVSAVDAKLSKYKRDNTDYIENAVLFELSRHEEFIAQHEMQLPDIEIRMNSMEKAFELLRKECMPPCKANAGALTYEMADGKVSILPFISLTEHDQNGKSDGGTDGKEPEND